MTTPRGAPELVESQAVPETTVNEQIRYTEAGASHFIVADNDLTAPPGACSDGASYIIAATATGDWTGLENQIATAVGTNAANGWLYHVPQEGYTAYIQDENARHLYGGSSWAADTTGGSYTDEQARDAVMAMISGTGLLTETENDGADTSTLDVPAASATEQLTGTSAAKASTPDSIAALWEQGSDIASSGTISVGEGGYFNITGTTTITDIDFATDKAGRKAWVKFAGILTLTYNGSTLILPTGASITTAAGDTAEFVSEGSDVVRCVAYTRANGQALAAGAVSLTLASTVTQSGTPVATSVGFLGAPQMSDQDDYTLALTDAGGHYYHVSGSTHTLTIPANASVAFPIGTVIAIVNENGGGNLSIAITSDTLRWGSSTGTRTLAANGTATLLKVTSTVWRLTGDGIT